MRFIQLTIFTDPSSQTSYLVILDANNMIELERAKLPENIHESFHGQFITSIKATSHQTNQTETLNHDNRGSVEMIDLSIIRHVSCHPD